MSRKEEEKSLLADECEPAGYGTDLKNPDDVTPPGPDPSEANSDHPPQGKGPQRNSKRTRLQRSPSLGKVDEDAERNSDHGKSSGCSDYIGVKSYLHHFYQGHSYKDPDVYEDDDDFRYLLHPSRKHRRCASIWWKVFVWIGANFLIFGIIGVLVGYLVPQKSTVFDAVPNNLQYIDHGAITFNYNLDVCKLVGLILFCIGGVTLTVALLFPSFLYQWCDDDRREAAFLVRAREQREPHSPVEMTIPATPSITEVQPDRKQDESVITKDGTLPYKD